MGVLRPVIELINQGVFNGNFAVGIGQALDIALGRIQQHRNGVFFIQRHQLIAQGIIGGVQEMAKQQSVYSPKRSKAGTTPEVLSVTRRLEMP